tara:strand:- start:665 stop:1810 length:1146 start_codon:yes stop_codon:yes gene_type:complete
MYSLCGDMLPMHLRPGERSIVKDRAQQPAALDPLEAAKKAADEARENAEAMAAENANAAEKQAADREEATEAKLADAAADAADSATKAAEATAEAKARDAAVRKDAADTAATATTVPSGVGEPAQAPVAEEAIYADAGVGTAAPAVPAYSAPAPSGSDASKAAGEPAIPAYSAPAPSGSDASKAAAEPAASPAADAQICWSTRAGVTDEWCMGMIGTEQAMCECGNAADRPAAKPAAIVPIDPNHVNGDSLTDWSGAPAPINTVPSAKDCVPIAVGYSDFWCSTTCATGSCPEELCKCGDAAKQESKEMIGQVKDNWAEAEKRARAAADSPGGCTVADCPGGLPSNAGKDEDSQESKEYDKAIDDWKEGEARIKAADPNEA